MAGNFNPAKRRGFNWSIEEKKNTFAKTPKNKNQIPKTKYKNRIPGTKH
jgi:hypothetical protein